MTELEARIVKVTDRVTDRGTNTLIETKPKWYYTVFDPELRRLALTLKEGTLVKIQYEMAKDEQHRIIEAISIIPEEKPISDKPKQGQVGTESDEVLLCPMPKAIQAAKRIG